MDGSAMSTQVLCGVGYSSGKEENASLPTVNTALGVAWSLLPFRSRRRPGLGTRPAARGPSFGTRAGVTPRPRQARSHRGS